MKRKLTTAIGASVIGLSAAIMPFTLTSTPVSAQVTQPDTAAPGVYDRDVYGYERNDFDWGWLGLLGLLGLAGLAGRGGRHDRNEATRYRDPNSTVGSSSYRE
ncbi:MAG: WGxxGxxG family protein [Scytonema sp. PMC 1069.18]|nr:WGxxGxxG family protein [Scytonema sp. PMC 1069.18]MEC4885689.1 WGxxGxxG family protein [Scytonema sp. PMC 1070.18]